MQKQSAENMRRNAGSACAPKKRRIIKVALTRKYLAAMGIEADKIDEIISAHSESLNAIKAERDQYKENAKNLEKVQKELDEIKEEKGTYAPYKDKYDKEHEAFENYKQDVTAKETKARKSNAYKELLKEAGVSEKHRNAVLRASDIDSLEFDDEGKVKNSKETIDSIKKDWSDFIVQSSTEGASTSTPPEGKDGEHHSTGRAAKIAQSYYANLYGTPNNGSNGKEGE